MKNLYIIFCFLILVSTNIFSQVGIGTANPMPNAELEIQSTTKGVLFPRMLRSQMTSIPNVTGMFAFQTNSASGTLPGFYYNYLGWLPLANPTSWYLTGRSGINPANQYVGTSTNQDFVLRTSNTAMMRFRSSTNNGNIGIGTNTPSTTLHVAGKLRIQDGFEAAGNFLTSTANGNTYWASPASLGFSGWSIIGNSLTDPSKNFLGTSDAIDLIIRTNNTEKMRVQANGNVRINVPGATANKLQVTANLPNLPTLDAKNTNTTLGTFSFGIVGESNSTALSSSGVFGVSINGGQNEIGVLGRYQTFGTGVFGRAWFGPTNTLTNDPIGNYSSFLPNRDYGVFGNVSFGTGKGVYGRNANLTIGSAYGMYSNGNMAVTGVTDAPTIKSASVPTTKGNQLVYCKESPEMWFEDFGFGELTNGVAHIKLDDLFFETVKIDDQHRMHVTLQEQVETEGLYVVIDRDHKGFTVKEKNNGASNGTFSYNIMAKRRFYQDQRFGVDANMPFENNLAKVTKDVPVATTDPMVMKAFVEKITAEKNELYGKKTSNETDRKSVV